ncbi:MAG: DUF2530 domain-containing protein [Actinomycetota bacterium]
MGRLVERHRDPPPLRTNDKRTMATGTALWLVLLVGLAVRHEAVRRAGLLWWYPMCASGIVLGLIGLLYLKVRPAQLARRQARRDAERRS